MSSSEYKLVNSQNPRNWSVRKKSYNIGVPALFCFVASLGSSIYAPAVPDVMKDFHVSPTVALLGLSMYVLGLCWGPIVAGPISEKYGRLPTYRYIFPIGMLFTVGAGFSPILAGVLICRFFAGFFSAGPLCVVSGTGADLFAEEKRGVSTGVWICCPFLGPAIGPVIGGYVSQAKGWQWTQWVLISYAASFGQEETYRKVLDTRAQRKSKSMDVPEGHTSSTFKSSVLDFLLVPIRMLFTDPIVFCTSLYMAFNFAVIFMSFASFPIIFPTVYGFTRGETGLAFLGIAVGSIVAVPTYLVIDRMLYIVPRRKRGSVEPEQRLFGAMIGALGMPFGLFWFAWTAKPNTHWISPVLAMVPVAWANLTVFIALGLYVTDVYGERYSASCIAANGIFRYLLAATFPLFTQKMFEDLGIGWAGSTLGFITVGLMAVPYALWLYGQKLRGMSKYASQESVKYHQESSEISPL
ncbi:putative bicyclomycin resistance protein [Aulographum hederae CBS 113979]|uniref:Putative bicyclomycin resistance protein n=1 Tax=Aulographum hederae CBS 113979 TaxID=1176131 RepID=A0A6G1GJP1_9PEZI|nr:putative bicyclomycin resistance protein [Aulographum hederae CBS 113979]